MQHKPKRRRSGEKGPSAIALLERIQPDAAGIDCGQNSHFVAVPPDRDPQPVREFRTFTTDLLPGDHLLNRRRYSQLDDVSRLPGTIQHSVALLADISDGSTVQQELDRC